MGFWSGESRYIYEFGVEGDMHTKADRVKWPAKRSRKECQRACFGQADTPQLSVAEPGAMRFPMIGCQEESSHPLSKRHASSAAVSRSMMVMDSPHRGQRHEL